MSQTTPSATRIDEVSTHYSYAETLQRICGVLFWVNAALALITPYSAEVLNPKGQSVLTTVFLVSVVVSTACAIVLRFRLIPNAERIRRRQFLSNALGARLTEEHTDQYYNNQFEPSIARIAANTFENSLFSKEVLAVMLRGRRWKTGIFLILWVVVISLRHDQLELLTWATQLVFSAEVLVEWLNMEILTARYKEVYEQLYAHFSNKRGSKKLADVAAILDAFVSYECAKAAAGTLLSSKIFNRLNPALSERWERIRKELAMDG